MRVGHRTTAVARRAGTVALVGVTVVAAVGLTRELPDPQLLAGMDNSCLQFSQDGGTIWGGADVITLDDSFSPVPGGEYLQGDFLARNTCATTATLQVYAGRWDASAGTAGTWRTDLDGEAGEAVALTGPAAEADWGVLVGDTEAPSGVAIPVRLYLGVPLAETAQRATITPGWAFALEHEGVAPAAPSNIVVNPTVPTSEQPVTVSGTAEPGSTVEVTVDGVVRCTTVAAADGTFSCSVGVLTPGEHVISATATNPDGTSEASAGVTVTVTLPGSDTGWLGWGSLADILGFGSLGALFGFGSLAHLLDWGSLTLPAGWTSLGDPAGWSSLGSLGLGSVAGSLGSIGGDRDDTAPGGPAPAGGSDAQSTIDSAENRPGGSGGSAPGGPAGSAAGGQGGSASEGTGWIPGGTVGLGAQASGGTGRPGGAEPGGGATGAIAGAGIGAGAGAGPGVGTGPGAGQRAGTPPVVDGAASPDGPYAGPAGHAAVGAIDAGSIGSAGSAGGLGSTGHAGSSGSLGSSGGPGSVDRLIHLGGPTIQVVPR